MRKPSPASVATAVVIALAGSAAFAQTVGRPAAPGTNTAVTAPRQAATAGSTVRPSSTTTPPRAGTSTTTTTTGFAAAPGNGSISSTAANSDGTTTTTLNVDGTRTLVTQSLDGTTTTTTLPTNLFNPALINGAVGGVTADGERMLDERDRALAIDRGTRVEEVQERALALLSSDLARSSVSLNRVIKDAEKDRRKIGRNGQLLHTIAPRTNVDRSHEMPDDGPTPALSGLSNSLTRR